MEQSNGNGQNGDSTHAASPRRNERTWTDIVKDDPVACLAIAAAAGFVLGGGARRAGGLTILTMLGQLVVREAFGASASSIDFITAAEEEME